MADSLSKRQEKCCMVCIVQLAILFVDMRLTDERNRGSRSPSFRNLRRFKCR